MFRFVFAHQVRGSDCRHDRPVRCHGVSTEQQKISAEQKSRTTLLVVQERHPCVQMRQGCQSAITSFLKVCDQILISYILG
jgi:hypothetical protein